MREGTGASTCSLIFVSTCTPCHLQQLRCSYKVYCIAHRLLLLPAAKVKLSVQVYTRLDQPQTALQQYKRVAAEQAGQVDMLLGQARIYDAINDIETGVTLYKEVTLWCD